LDWLRRLRRVASGAPEAPIVAAPEPVLERATLGVATLFDGVREDRSHAVLDLGPADGSSLEVYGRFAGRVRFADLSAMAGSDGWGAALDALPPQPERPYDLLFVWDLLDRATPEVRPRLVARLAEICAPDARLHLMVEASDRGTTRPFRFSLVGTDRMRYEATGDQGAAGPRLLPAEVERLLSPFKVVRAFTSQVGMREYVAVRGGG